MKKILIIALLLLGNMYLYSQGGEKKMFESRMETQTGNWLRANENGGEGDEDATPPGEPDGAAWGAPLSDGLLALSLLSCGYLLLCIARHGGRQSGAGDLTN
jgi:hypothetical protein